MCCFAAGVIPILAALDLGPIRLGDDDGPAWAVGLAGALFWLFGAAVLLGDSPLQRRIAFATVVVMFLGFAALGNWAAFGPGTRACSGGISAWFFAWNSVVPELECRIAFGLGACMGNGLVVWGLGSGLNRFMRPHPLFTWLEKTGRGLFLLALAPIVALIVLLIFGRELFAAVRRYRKDGQWPGIRPLIERVFAHGNKPPK